METSTLIAIIVAVIVVIAVIAIIIIILKKRQNEPTEDENAGESTETFHKRKPSKEPYTVKKAKDINKKIDDYISQWIA